MYNRLAVDYFSVGEMAIETEEINSDNFSLADFVELDDPDLFAKTKSFLACTEDTRKKGYYSYRRPLLSACRNRVIIYDEMTGKEKEMIMMASNNYLDLCTDPRVVSAARTP